MNRTLLLVAALLAAGCVGAPALPLTPLAAPSATGAYTWTAPVAYDANGTARDVPADVAQAVEQLVPGVGAEPNIGVTSKGNIFVTTLDQVRRSADHGRTWSVVEDFAPPGAPTTDDQFSTADPMLWVDADTDRVFADQMHPALLCTWMSWSDDEGASWTQRPLDCTTPGLDHQKVMTAKPGPVGPPLPAGAYPNLVYMCVNKRLDTGAGYPLDGMGTSCMTSFDGGLSFPLEREAYVNDHLCGNINGHPAAFPDGTVAFALGNLGPACDRPLTVVLSDDDGVTWQARQCDPKLGQVEIDADITVTPDGTAYLLYRDHDQLVHLLRSKDEFRTCQSFRVAPPGQALDEFTAITSGDDGRLAMAYLGTRDAQDPGATPSNATLGSRWHLFVTTSLDAEAADPTFVTTQVTPEQDPVQVGCIWLEGGAGGPHGCRNLLDFIDMVHDKDGRWYVAFTDGCVPRNGCTGAPDLASGQSRERQVGVAVQTRGPSLLAAKGDVAPLDLAPPVPLER